MSSRPMLTVIALGLCVFVVAGSETRPAAPPAVAAQEPAAAAREVSMGLEDRLERPGLGEPLANAFAPRRAAPAPPAARVAPVAPAAPVAPPVPLRYVGRILDEGEIAVFVAPNDELFLAVPGATLGRQYQVQEVTPAAVTLVYLPLGTRQVVPIPARD